MKTFAAVHQGSFCFLVVSLPGYSIRVILKEEFGSVPSVSIFLNNLKSINCRSLKV